MAVPLVVFGFEIFKVSYSQRDLHCRVSADREQARRARRNRRGGSESVPGVLWGRSEESIYSPFSSSGVSINHPLNLSGI